jgi:hypothetical protein
LRQDMVIERGTIGGDGNMRHIGNVFHNANGLAFGRFRGAVVMKVLESL